MQAPCKRSQKLGDKITALQQLVSPYGKVNTSNSWTGNSISSLHAHLKSSMATCSQTDTASVLHEAATCIKNLHEQIQVSRFLHQLLTE
jgi:hypothetical protein